MIETSITLIYAACGGPRDRCVVQADQRAKSADEIDRVMTDASYSMPSGS